MLTISDYNRLAQIKNTLSHTDEPSQNEVFEYLSLIQKTGIKGQKEISDLMLEMKAENLTELANKLSKKENQGTLKGLEYAGLGILLGWAVSEVLQKAS